jgi:TolA-binding protein
MLNKAREIMKQRESMIKEAQETLVVLGATNEATVVTNEIVINKGKVVEVPVVKEVVKYETKEVVVDNTDTATIEMLRETIRNMNQTINDMNKNKMNYTNYI